MAIVECFPFNTEFVITYKCITNILAFNYSTVSAYKAVYQEKFICVNELGAGGVLFLCHTPARFLT